MEQENDEPTDFRELSKASDAGYDCAEGKDCGVDSLEVSEMMSHTSYCKTVEAVATGMKSEVCRQAAVIVNLRSFAAETLTDSDVFLRVLENGNGFYHATAASVT